MLKEYSVLLRNIPSLSDSKQTLSFEDFSILNNIHLIFIYITFTFLKVIIHQQKKQKTAYTGCPKYLGTSASI